MSLHTAGNLDRPQDFPAFPLFSENMFSFSQVLTDVSALEKKASILLTKSKGAFIAKRILGKGHVSISYGPTGTMKFLCLD